MKDWSSPCYLEKVLVTTCLHVCLKWTTVFISQSKGNQGHWQFQCVCKMVLNSFLSCDFGQPMGYSHETKLKPACLSLSSWLANQ